ncbi:hypothetical protein C8R43DRAFT_184643 [Mycena crocata]|nr:hypothetical protein C8R43DRAFT_184643 [Mycena crocata]
MHRLISTRSQCSIDPATSSGVSSRHSPSDFSRPLHCSPTVPSHCVSGCFLGQPFSCGRSDAFSLPSLMQNLHPRRLASKVLSLRLQYSIQRPYPGRWTTPIVCALYFAITILLVMVNIPLAAYDVVQIFTYTPNDTAPPLRFSNLIPSSLQHSAGDFMPQTFKIGDSLQTNLSLFDYQISTAWQPETFTRRKVAAFAWYNNPLSNCDISNITLSLRKDERAVIMASVGCWSPVPFAMTFNMNHQSLTDTTGAFLDVVDTLDRLLTDLEYGWDAETFVFQKHTCGCPLIYTLSEQPSPAKMVDQMPQ